MNPLWSLFFKDKYRTPFSVYKMSLAELVFLGATIFGIGYALSEGVIWVLNIEQITSEKAIQEG